MKTLTALLMMAGPLSAYTLHEWGTFTTVAGSDGVLLEGLDREEAPLPRFTYSHYGLENGNMPRLNGRPVKGMMRRPLAGVTVKMETPVIYFHSDQAFDVNVKVGFTGGTISQWYPDRSGGETLPPLPRLPANPTPEDHAKRVLDFSKPYKGSIEWQARVLSPEESRDAILFRPGETLHWMRPRVPEANAVRTAKGETEGFLFYRGIGNFDPGLRTTVSGDETLHLENRSGGAIPFAFVFERDGLTTRWSRVKGGLANGAKAEVPKAAMAATELTPEMIEAGIREQPFPEPVYREMVEGLTATGLLKSEATAMVETWWESYFETEGLRVFWVLPESRTVAILPLEVSPAPKKQVRVLVGRSEVIRPGKERDWLALSRSKDSRHLATWDHTVKNDRFGKAYQHRVEALNATVCTAD